MQQRHNRIPPLQKIRCQQKPLDKPNVTGKHVNITYKDAVNRIIF